MSRKIPLPPELNPLTVSGEELRRAVRQHDHRQFYAEISQAVREKRAIDPADQAKVLRHMADQLEKGRLREDVLERSKQRVYARFPALPFFQFRGDKSQYWEGRGKEPTRVKHETKPSRADYWAERAKAAAAEHQPMRYYVVKDREQERGR